MTNHHTRCLFQSLHPYPRKGSSVQLSRLTLSGSQRILAHLLEIKTTMEQSINK